MNIALGFGQTETDYEDNLGREFEQFVKSEFDEVCKAHSFAMVYDHNAKRIREWLTSKAGESRSMADQFDESDKPPARYSSFHATLTDSASDVVAIVDFTHINRKHALSPDGWGLLQTKRLFHVSSTDHCLSQESEATK